MISQRAGFKADHTLFGLILGLVAPWLGFCIFYLVRFLPYQVSFFSYVWRVFSNRFLLAPVLSLCLIVNAVLFFIYIRYRKDLTAKGLLVATLLYGVAIVILKFL